MLLGEEFTFLDSILGMADQICPLETEEFIPEMYFLHYSFLASLMVRWATALSLR